MRVQLAGGPLEKADKEFTEEKAMCNLRNNITLRSSTATLCICLFLKGFVF